MMGELFFKNIRCFIESEDANREDSEEFLMTKNQIALFYKQKDELKYKSLLMPNEIIAVRAATNSLIYCLTDFKKSNLESLNGKNSLGEKFINGLSQGDTGLVLVLIDKNKFLHKLNEYFVKYKMDYDMKNCTYEDLSEKNHNYLFNNDVKFRKKEELS